MTHRKLLNHIWWFIFSCNNCGKAPSIRLKQGSKMISQNQRQQLDNARAQAVIDVAAEQDFYQLRHLLTLRRIARP